ncbi:peptidase T [Aerococcus kribbianus]|uniref:Peptidase T n=1 Tax=Aerococcus kribbianus TaxID=2999064 RepID=A0A9X3FR10_9LACT|nr:MULTISPECIES: peptidase T [unclassified Aerococcus]MCZ0716747.1 peptidase T [Aerococcus sp. YH-aer221]MCZ0725035.1 peptidase T [Aerococcus sp. YH-aer222]
MTYHIDREFLLDRFLTYVKEDTQSDEAYAHQVPSTAKQVDFAKKLIASLADFPLEDIFFNDKDAYVTATLPSNDPEGNYPTIAFFAHVDTADFNGSNVSPQIIEDYQGQVIDLGESGYQLDPEVFPSLNKYHGQTLITTDGTTLLGADDKAGIAEIVTAIAYLVDHPEIKHGDIKIAFGPDEEIGVGADRFDVDRLAADFAYTMDGGPLGELQYETFNAAAAKVKIAGKNVHPGTAKDTMINALQLAVDFHAALPEDQRPETTDGRDGFYHLMGLTGKVDEAEMSYIIRDHDREIFEDRKAQMLAIADKLNAEWGHQVVQVELNDQYYNMGDILQDDMRPIKLAQKAFQNVGIEAEIEAVRGGTDGSKLTYMGLPTPNIFAGGENMHGRFEYVSLQTMEKASQVIVAIAALAGQYHDL